MPLEDHAERVLDLVATIPEGRVLAYGDIARRLGGMGPRTVGTVMSRYGSDVPWWRVIRSDGRPPQGLEDEALGHWRAEGTPMVGGLLDGGRADMARARWDFGGAVAGSGAVGGAGSRGGLHHVEIWVEDIAAAGREWGWLLGRLGYHLGDDWGHGQAWDSTLFWCGGSGRLFRRVPGASEPRCYVPGAPAARRATRPRWTSRRRPGWRFHRSRDYRRSRGPS